jgi:formate-dependent nitrite reductase membrane component NrfD
MSYREAAEMPEEVVVKPKWKLPENFKTRLDAMALLGVLFGIVFFAIGGIFHGLMVQNSSIPHTDPPVVTFFLVLSGIAMGVASMIFVGRVSFYLFQIILGRREY